MGDVSLENAHAELRPQYLVASCKAPSALAKGDAQWMLS